jgi:hypothetical protein
MSPTACERTSELALVQASYVMPATCFAKSQRHQFQETEQRRRLSNLGPAATRRPVNTGGPHSRLIGLRPGRSQHRCCRVWRWNAGTRNARLPPLSSGGVHSFFEIGHRGSFAREMSLAPIQCDIQNTASITTWAEMRIDCTMVAVDARREPPHLRRSRHAIGRYHGAIDSPPYVWSDRSCISHSI